VTASWPTGLLKQYTKWRITLLRQAIGSVPGWAKRSTASTLSLVPERRGYLTRACGSRGGWRARQSARPSPQEMSNHGFVASATVS
jgi:hypothetical protein